MNSLFIPSYDELELIKQIKVNLKSDFTCFRITSTMINKSIIDASYPFREILKNNKIVNYNNIAPGKKEYQECIIIDQRDIHKTNTSFYRPKSKQGDPRFWPSGLNKYIKEFNLVLFTIFNKRPLLVIIDLENRSKILSFCEQFLKITKNKTLIKLERELNTVKNKGWIKSIGGNRRNDKDVGLTLENELDISPNSNTLPDYLNKIEIKSKRKQVKTMDSLFAKVPDWSLSTRNYNPNSPHRKSSYYLTEFGIPSDKHIGFKTLYVTVSAIPNPQGMFLHIDNKSKELHQYFSKNQKRVDYCIWNFSVLEECLYKKHNQTVWVTADERENNGLYEFKYESFELSEKPSFNQFISLIPLNLITIDWTHRVLPNGKESNDHGFLFRIKPINRELLFGSIKKICE